MLVLVLACLGQFVVIMDTSIVNVALPSIGRSLAFTAAGLAWVVNAYTITFAGFLLPAGRAADVYGRRRVFVAGLALFCLASAAGGLAPSATVLIAARAVQGIAAAVVSAAALAVLITGFPEGSARNRALAAWGAAAAAGGAIGTVAGGVLTDLVSWRAVLLINVPIGLIMIAGAARLLPGGHGSHSRGLDLPGALTATAGVAAFAFGVVQASTSGWTSPLTLAPMLAGVAVFGVFLLLEARLTKAPTLPLGLFRSRSLSVGNLLMALVGATSVSMWYFISLYLQRVAGYDPLAAGLAIAPFALAIAAASWATPQILRWTGRRWLITASSLMATAGFAWWSVSLDPGAGYPLAVLLPGLLAATGTSGLVIAPIAGAATAGVRPENNGVASGLANATRMLGGAIGLAVLATLAAGSHTGSPTPKTLAAGYDRAFLIAAGIALVTAAVSLLIPTHRKPSAGTSLTSNRPTAENGDVRPAQGTDWFPSSPKDSTKVERRTPSSSPMITGRVRGVDHKPVPAVLTLANGSGNQINHGQTGPDGTYQLAAPTGGVYLLVCVPARPNPGTDPRRAALPQAAWVALDGHTAEHDFLITST